MESYLEFKTLEEFNSSMGFEPIGTNIPLKDFFKNDQCECGYAPHEKVNSQIYKLMKRNRRSYGQNISQIEENIEKEKVCPSNFQSALLISSNIRCYYLLILFISFYKISQFSSFS